jgi:hypothetical protein
MAYGKQGFIERWLWVWGMVWRRQRAEEVKPASF